MNNHNQKIDAFASDQLSQIRWICTQARELCDECRKSNDTLSPCVGCKVDVIVSNLHRITASPAFTTTQRARVKEVV